MSALPRRTDIGEREHPRWQRGPGRHRRGIKSAQGLAGIAAAVAVVGMLLVIDRYWGEWGWSSNGLSSIVFLGEVQQPALGEWIGVAGDLADAGRLFLEIIFVHELTQDFMQSGNILQFHDLSIFLVA
jgi:hypothetical protein